MIFRMISFCLDKIDLLSIQGKNSVKENENYNFIDYFNYIFYPTFFFISPFVTYKNFYQVFVSISLSKRVNIFLNSSSIRSKID
jgi:hypothetical protein